MCVRVLCALYLRWEIALQLDKILMCNQNDKSKDIKVNSSVKRQQIFPNIPYPYVLQEMRTSATRFAHRTRVKINRQQVILPVQRCTSNMTYSCIKLEHRRYNFHSLRRHKTGFGICLRKKIRARICTARIPKFNAFINRCATATTI